MSVLTVEGIVFRISYRSSNKPVVFIDEKDHDKLTKWWIGNNIQTIMEKKNHPISHVPCPQIQADSKAKNIKDGTAVTITLGVAFRMKDGNKHLGIETIDIKPMSKKD
jgi:hypothetical protein